MTQDQNIPVGYKQTDAGVIPEDWEVKELRDICVYQNGKALESFFNDHDGYSVVSIGNYSPEGSFVSTKTYIDKKYKSSIEKYLLKSGDLAMILNDKTSLGTILGRTLLISKNDEFVFNQRTMRIRPKSVQPEFLHYLINFDFIHKVIVGKSMPGTQIYINTSDVLRLKLSLPVNSVERDRIIEVIKDIDSLISKLDQLIQKKKNIKQGAMQELLTGKRRLPGFSGEWEHKAMGEIGVTYGGLSGKVKSDFEKGSFPYIPFMNIMSNPIIDTTYFDYVNIKPSENQNKASKGDLFFNGSSETPEEVGMCSALLEDIPNLYLNSFCFGFKLNKELKTNSLYLAYFYRSDVGRKLIFSLAQGATRYNLSKTKFMKLEIPYPDPEEQTALANTFSDMDSEIFKLQIIRDKYAELKQGMMQQLLTGKIRLI